MIRNGIVWFAWLAPIFLLLLWPHQPYAAVGVLMLSHALILYPTLRPNVQWLGPVITAFSTDRDEVWLTIDDGPDNDTPQLLDLLDELSVRATFFVTGKLSEANPEHLRSIVSRGHEVANHSQTHPSGTFWCLPPAAIAAEIAACSAVLERIAGVRPRLFRAPVGMKNPSVHPQLRKRELTLVGWTVRGFDSVDADEVRVASRILPRVHPGAVLVMHQGREHSVRCIRHVIVQLQERGYSFVIPESGRLKTNR